jgi:hypothetical protein
MRTHPLWLYLVFPALTMSLGWGLRGSIGGGPLGAMIPGAMVGLALCLLLEREADAGRVAALASVGVGFGGQETYGQTVGLSLQPETFQWAILGFAIKGAAWGLLGGAAIGAALQRIEAIRAATGFALMALGTWAGWRLVNSPRLIYFSNRLDRPREELWAGLLLGGVLLLAGMRSRLPWRFGLWGALGGGVGFALGASLQPWGRGVWAAMPLGWWKAMELTFGALLGLSYGWCAWRHRSEAEFKGATRARVGLPRAFAHAAAAVALTILAEEYLPGRFGYTLSGAALMGFVLFSESLAWQTAITATYAAFAWDLAGNQKLAPEWVSWAWVILTSAAVCVVVARQARARAMFHLLTWTAILTAFRYVLPPAKPSAEAITMLVVFTLLGAAVAAMAIRFQTHPSLDKGPKIRYTL